MDSNFKKIIPFTKPYRSHMVWNVIFNIFYALFSTLSFIALIPMMDVLFGTSEKINKKPVLESIFDIIKFSKEYLYYNITQLTDEHGPEFALLLVIGIVSITFLLKNLFNYLASNHLMHLKNGVLKDLRNSMYNKIINLPVSYYSEKRKGDIMARMLGDVNEVQNSFFSILELIVKEPMTIIFTLIGMIAISFKLTLFVFIFIPLSGLLISKIGKSLRSKSE
ncbi:MAG: ABC transporter transmembrane domain-containing protein, partial [Flavobacterium sp.]|nr:ABC transporter transmembrane domain-containing protein [Flavobacterium sp.]